MPTNLFLLPLVGGYWFLHALYFTRYRSQRLDGYRLLVESAFAGLSLVIIARPLVVIVNECARIRSFWDSVAPGEMPYLGTACAAVLLGLVAPYCINFLLEKTGILTEITAQQRAIQRYGNHFLRLLHTAHNEERFISVTLDNGKVYIGFVSAAPNLEPHDTHLSVTPVYSGYRAKDNLELHLTVDYLKVCEEQGLNAEDFKVVLPVANVRMLSFFDQAAYPSFLVEAPPSLTPK